MRPRIGRGQPNLLRQSHPRFVPVPQGPFPAAAPGLADRALRHRPQRAIGARTIGPRHELVHQGGRGCPGPGHQGGAHPVAVDWGGGQRRDRVFVQVAGEHDPGVGRAELVEQRADVVGQHQQVATVDPHRTEVGARQLDRGPHRAVHVERIHQQRRALAQGVELGAERVPLAVVYQGERVRAGPGRRDAVQAVRLQVRRGRKAHEVGRPGAGHGGLLVRAPRPHLDERPPASRGHHPGSGGRDRTVVVEDRQSDRLEDDRLGERALDDQDRRAGKVAVAFRITPDVPGKTV